jgi:glycosyltransferase involved in cell wall biosynthesis
MNNLSVVIPHKGDPKYLYDAIDSAINQSYKPMEIIVVIDGKIECDTMFYSSMIQPRVYFYSSPSTGVAAARNFGVEQATGEFIAFLDSDDIWHIDKLQNQREFLTDNYAFVHGPALEFYEKDFSLVELKIPQFSDSYENLLFGLYSVTGSSSSVVLRKSIFSQIGGFDEKMSLAEDWDLWVRLRTLGPIGFAKDSISYLRLHSSSSQRQVLRGLITRRDLDFYAACQIWEKHLHNLDYPFSIDELEILKVRLTWQILSLRWKILLYFFVLNFIFISDFPNIWKQIFPTKFAYFAFVRRILLLNSYRKVRKVFNVLSKLHFSKYCRLYP